MHVNHFDSEQHDYELTLALIEAVDSFWQALIAHTLFSTVFHATQTLVQVDNKLNC